LFRPSPYTAKHDRLPDDCSAHDIAEPVQELGSESAGKGILNLLNNLHESSPAGMTMKIQDALDGASGLEKLPPKTRSDGLRSSRTSLFSD
jgi:hypothetical protein